MKTNFWLTGLLVFLFSIQLQAEGLKLFVAPSGSDNGPGTELQPLYSLKGARDRIREMKKVQAFNDTIFVILKPGNYALTSTFQLGYEDSGSAEAPIIYQAENPDQTTISGGIELTGFVETDQGLWVAEIPEVSYWNWRFDQLFVNGKRATRAKSPNNGYFLIKDIEEEVWVQGTGRNPERAQQIVTANDDAASILASLSESEAQNVIMTVYHHWNITKRYIDKFDTEHNTIYTSGQGMKPWNPWKPGKRFILENYRAALDTPGEWFLDDDGTLYYKPFPGEKIENSTFYAPVIEQLVRIDGQPAQNKFVQHVAFEGLHFQYAAYNLPKSGFEPYQAAISIDAAIEINGAKYIKFNDCHLEHTGGYGIWLNQGVSSCEIKHSLLQDLGAGGIRIGELTIREEASLQTHSNVVDNNIIQSGGFDFAPGVGVLIGQSADNEITHNDIGDFRYTGVSVGWVWGYNHSPAKRNKINFNHIHHIGWGVLSDMSGVYTLGKSEGTEVSNNHIHHIYAYDYGGWGLYTDEGSSNIIMENNLVHHTKTGGFHQHYGRENTIRNNIFAFSKMYQLQATRVEDHQSFSFSNNIVLFDEGVLFQGPWTKMNVEIDQNLYWKLTGDVDFIGGNLQSWQKHGYDQHSVLANPDFINAQSGNFNFKKLKTVKKIKFEPFDYTEYGVYGDKAWREKAKLPGKLIEAFDQLYK